jgi:hypothetical protein|tara:strand:- start:266 stop:367 length:102 start_codon:yes stop_codon:yes gene_type:complete
MLVAVEQEYMNLKLQEQPHLVEQEELVEHLIKT